MHSYNIIIIVHAYRVHHAGHTADKNAAVLYAIAATSFVFTDVYITPVPIYYVIVTRLIPLPK